MMDKGYVFYLDGILFPIAPSSMTTKINNKNRVVSLINDGDFNILKEAGLQEFSFEFCLPAYKYPFARYVGGIFLPIKYYLSILDILKNTKKPFRFIVIREGTLGTVAFNTCLTVSLEDFTVKEDANNGKDVIVSIVLKEYKTYDKLLKIVQTGSTVFGVAGSLTGFLIKNRDSSSKKTNRTYKVREGDTLFIIAKRELGDEKKCEFLKKINNLKSIHDIKLGQVIRLE